jgi:hypothetical protein
MKRSIQDVVGEYLSGDTGAAAILFHKKGHRRGSGEFACVRGLIYDCDNSVNCPNVYTNRQCASCSLDGQEIGGLLGVEEKHRTLVDKGAFGAYVSINEALEDLNAQLNLDPVMI